LIRSISIRQQLKLRRTESKRLRKILSANRPKKRSKEDSEEKLARQSVELKNSQLFVSKSKKLLSLRVILDRILAPKSFLKSTALRSQNTW